MKRPNDLAKRPRPAGKAEAISHRCGTRTDDRHARPSLAPSCEDVPRNALLSGPTEHPMVTFRDADQPRHNYRYALMVAAQNIAPERRADPRSGRTHRHICARGARRTERRFGRDASGRSACRSVRLHVDHGWSASSSPCAWIPREAIVGLHRTTCALPRAGWEIRSTPRDGVKCGPTWRACARSRVQGAGTPQALGREWSDCPRSRGAPTCRR
jgi:hypothetical protein